MARDFTSDTHNLRTSTFVQPGSVGTVSLWVYPGWAHNDNAVHEFFAYGEYLPTYNEFSFQKYSDNNVYIGWAQGGNDDRISIAATSGMFSNGVWNNHVFTWDDPANTCEYFSGGVSQSARTADLQTFTIVGQETIGNALDDLTQIDSQCRIAEFGMWNVVLTSSEIAALAKGFSPLLIRPDALVEYHQLFGDGTTETCQMGASILTVTGAAKAAHPPIIYPSNVYSYVPSAGGGGTTYNDSLTESLTTADSYTSALSAVGALTESMALADSYATALTALASVAESTTLADAYTTALTALVTLGESVTLADSYADALNGGGTTYNESFTEALTVGDTYGATLIALASIVEAATLGDNLATISTMVASYTQAITLTDSYADSGGLYVADAARTIMVGAEYRTLSVPLESRTWTVT